MSLLLPVLVYHERIVHNVSLKLSLSKLSSILSRFVTLFISIRMFSGRVCRMTFLCKMYRLILPEILFKITTFNQTLSIVKLMQPSQPICTKVCVHVPAPE